MAIQPGDILEVSYRFAHVGSNRAMNVFNYAVVANNGNTNQEFADAVTDDMAAIYNLWLASFLTSSIRGTTAVWRYWDPATSAWVQIAESDFNVVGLSLNDGISLGAAAVVHLPHDGGGRSGRKFIYGLSEATTGNSLFTPLTAATLAGWGADVAAPVGDIGARVQPIVLHEDKSYHAMSGIAIVDPRVGYQRRRKQGIGW